MIFDITRLTDVAGQDFNNSKCRVRSPHITARDSIEIGDYIVAQQRRIAELEEERDVRNLEQQEKGVYDVRVTTGFWNLSTCALRQHLREYEDILNKQAKALKEQGK